MILAKQKDGFKITQYACAVLLVSTSIALAFSQALVTNDIAQGILIYIAQAFLLAGSIFGLDYYVKRIKYEIDRTSGNKE